MYRQKRETPVCIFLRQFPYGISAFFGLGSEFLHPALSLSGDIILGDALGMHRKSDCENNEVLG